MSALVIDNIGLLVTNDPELGDGPLGTVRDAALVIDGERVAAVERAGFAVEKTTEGDNPIYAVSFVDDVEPMQCFSKVYDQEPNPREGFAAVMTCSAADAACPTVFGAAERFAIPFDDPKAFDGTDRESAKYDERCRQIAREMLYVFSQV